MTVELKEEIGRVLSAYAEEGTLMELFLIEFEKPFIKEVLNKYNCNICVSAKHLGISRSTLKRKCIKYKIALKKQLV